MRILCFDRRIYKGAWKSDRICNEQAGDRLHKLRLWEELRLGGKTAQQAAILVKIPVATLYRWAKRLQLKGPKGLEPGSTRPHRFRQSTQSTALTRRVTNLRRQYPLWGRAKIATVLGREGTRVSFSTVGRILREQIQLGRLKTVRAVMGRPKARSGNRPWNRHHAQRLPRGLKSEQAGALVQFDAMELTKDTYGAHYWHFSAICPVTRLGVAKVYRNATSANAADFLHWVMKQLPIPLLSAQVDGGSEFRGEFEKAFKKISIPLYVLPPKRPNINGAVERFNGICRYEFYQILPSLKDLENLRCQLAQFQTHYNTYRPHEALSYQTPYESMGLSVPPEGPLSHMC